MIVATGLRGETPLGLLASLGLQSAYLSEGASPTLHFDADRRPVLGVEGTVSDIALQILRAAHDLADNEPVARHDDVKFKGSTAAAVRQASRDYLASAGDSSTLAARLAMSLSVEGATNSSGNTAASSLLHFGGPKIRYLAALRDSIDALEADALEAALLHPQADLSRFRWGASDGRSHARERRSPSDDRDRRRMLKLTSPALSTLAMMGLARYPSWLGPRDRVLTTGCSAPRHQFSTAEFTWPLWSRPCRQATVDTLVGAVRPDPGRADIEHFVAWGITEIRSASILVDERSYGSFAATAVVWQHRT